MRPVPTVQNLSAYCFVQLADPHAWRAQIHAQAQARALRGTVLLAHEGINLVLAGAPEALDGFMAWLRHQAPFAALDAKLSWSPATPFRRLRVKVKPEIIRMNQPTVTPQRRRAPAVDAPTLARWLDAGHDDAGRPIALLDTRNGFEVDQGCFVGALDWRLTRFGDFPRALREHQDELRGKTVVTYCTGGIRCEKAALWMAQTGLEPALQLEGGILRYLEHCGARHFQGACFVFDERVALDERLAPTALPATVLPAAVHDAARAGAFA